MGREKLTKKIKGVRKVLEVFIYIFDHNLKEINVSFKIRENVHVIFIDLLRYFNRLYER
jgi:hypothetical protein